LFLLKKRFIYKYTEKKDRDILDIMDDQLLLSDNTDDDQAQGDGSSSSINSDDENPHPLTSSLTSFLSNEDIDKCLYVTNINWRRRFSVSLFIFEKTYK
jgi:hypothetical protein